MVKIKEVLIKFKTGDELIIKNIIKTDVQAYKGIIFYSYCTEKEDFSILCNEILYIKETNR